MLKVIDIVYHSHNEHDKPQEVLKIHAPATGFAAYIKDRVDIQFVKHLNHEGTEKINGIKYSFFKSSNRFWYIPFKTHRYIKSQRPDIVLVEGLIFPLQLMMLKYQLGKKVKIIAQQHNDRPSQGIRGFFQKMADRSIDIYLFTSFDDAGEWISKGIIQNINKCREVFEASSFFSRQDKTISREKTGMKGTNNFLWVGRLDVIKDPVTVLKGFEKFACINTDAKLFMIYQSGNQQNIVEKTIHESDTLKNSVKLIGKINHDELVYWYSAADFYISGSHSDATNYALLEAMACGCIPVVTNIPSFIKMTSNGTAGFLYEAGNMDKLAKILQQLDNINIAEKSKEVEKHFRENLDFKNIADRLFDIFNEII